MSEKSYWLAFTMCPGIGPAKFASLLSTFGSAENAWKAPLSDLKATAIGGKAAEKIDAFRKKFSIESYEEELQKKQVTYVTLPEFIYPHLLKNIKNPPMLLFIKSRGDDKWVFDEQENTKTIAVVGTRKLTAYGRQVTEYLTRELVEAGLIIVSGLALGVDSIAHRTTLQNNGRTIAVLGCGVDCCNPSSNQSLYNSILQGGGVIISEYAPGVPPSPGTFPARNRIIAGLSQGVLVTEGAADSGSLITAHDAIDNGRKVFAVPGPITSQLSQGANSLISKGAIMVTDTKSILDALSIGSKTKLKKIPAGDTEDEQKIIDLLSNEQLTFDELVRCTRMTSAELGSLLSLLEMKGIITNLDTNTFALAN